jgi:membrane protein DedA with SNARE-associated domain
MLQRLVDILGEGSLATGYGFVLLVLLLCGMGLPVPEDIILVTGGVLAWLASPLSTATFPEMIHDPGLVGMVAVGLLGVLAGDSVVYYMGRRYGVRVAEFWPLRRMVTPAKLERVEKLMRRKGAVVVLVARYLPGLRAPTFFTAGHSRFPYLQFLLFDGMAALVSAPFWVCLGFYFGDDIKQAAKQAKHFSHWFLAAALIVTALLLFRWFRRRRVAAMEEKAHHESKDVDPFWSSVEEAPEEPPQSGSGLHRLRGRSGRRGRRS